MTHSAGDPVPSITEAAATGDIKAIYEDIKAVLGAPVVNLIFRHIATLPGCLEWSWSGLRPLYAGQQLEVLAQRLMADLPLPATPRLSLAALHVVGVDAAAVQTITRILDAYNHTNPVNLLALSALRLCLDDSASVSTGGNDDVETSAPFVRGAPPALPRLLSLGEMDASTATLVQALNGLGAQAEDRTMASMYRQLAHWPGYLALALTSLQPLHASGALQAAAAHAQGQARAHARQLVNQFPRRARDTAPQGETRCALVSALGYFTTNLIVEMVPVGSLLRATLPV